MPELPEVETVRAGLERWIVGRTIAAVDSLHPRAVRRHSPGAADLAERLIATTVVAVHRRGKYLWLSLDADTAGSDCLILHLGMSGQLLVSTPQAPDGPHLRGRIRFRDDGTQLRFVDQRTFGAMQLDALRTDGPSETPSSILHIGRDPLDPYFDDRDWIRRTRARRTTIKRALLDQSLMSGVGNIYADEALWRAKLHGDRPTASLSSTQLTTLLTDLRSVFGEALRAGGTSFDALYVDVNGQSGYFDRSLAVYGRAGEACRRCGKPISRAKWMNRSSYFCPGCQPRPRAVRKV